MASIESYNLKSGEQRYRVHYREPDGRGVEKSGFATKRDANAFIAKTESRKLDGEYIAPERGRVTVGELGQRWLRIKEGSLKPSGYRSYESAWRIHVEPEWGRTQLSKVARLDIQEWVTDLGEDLGAKSVQRCHGVLHGVLQTAVENRMLPSNPASRIELPTPDETDPVFLTHSQLEAFITEAGRGRRTRVDAPAIVAVLGYCGLRWGELAALTPERIDGNRLHVLRNAAQAGSQIVLGPTKGGKRRVVPLPRRVQLLVAPIVNSTKSGQPVFPAEGGGYAKSPGADTWFSRAVARCQEADPTFPALTPHKLRHTAISLAIRTGCSIKVIQKIAGHASATMTLDRYGHLMSDELDEVADALDAATSRVTGICYKEPAESYGNPTNVINLDNFYKPVTDVIQ
ncbi:tyrosine-type recombinase/integrase [Mycobacteroides abscessus]|uniref:tyrosine-type recombinase/integrase n=1 Tax=Mycobacteroides abscessus TaxID=36809 RepID=UPI000C2665C1|nr:site-specific integrase [Mycobacteroides abscessus]